MPWLKKSNNKSKEKSKKTIEVERLINPFPSSISLLLQTYAALPAEEKPLIPFMLLDYLAANHLRPLMKAVISEGGSGDISGTALTTSCINTTYASAVIFFGASSAKTIWQRLQIIPHVSANVNLPSGNGWKYRMENLFGGDIVSMANEQIPLDDKESLKKMTPYISICANSFFKASHPLIENILKKQLSDETIITALKSFQTQATNYQTLLALLHNRLHRVDGHRPYQNQLSSRR